MGFRVLAAVALVACMSCGSKPSTTAQSLKTDTTMQTTTPLVRISTNLGDIVVRLYDETPEHRDNFLKLAREGYYDSTLFHRVIKDFMIQGGDPKGNGTGGSEHKITGEFSANGIENTISHTRGTISMARSKNYNSASSQFFIVQADSTYLDGDYAAFGRVTSGMEVVDQICADARPLDKNGKIAPDAQPVIQSVTILKDQEGGGN